MEGVLFSVQAFLFPESDRPIPSLVLISRVNDFFQEFMIYVTIGGSVMVVSLSYSHTWLRAENDSSPAALPCFILLIFYSNGMELSLLNWILGVAYFVQKLSESDKLTQVKLLGYFQLNFTKA